MFADSVESHSMRTLKVIISLLVSLGIMVFIFMLSAQNSGESGSLSESVARMLASMLVAGFDELSAIEQASIIDDWSWPVRKTAHATEYGCLAISWCVSCWQIVKLWQERSGDTSSEPHPLKIVYVAFLISVANACSDELHQLMVDGRAGQLADVLVDASGALIGCALCYAAMRISSQVRKSR